MQHELLLARYGEIGLKSRTVRRRFEAQLRDNIENAFQVEDVDVVVKRIPGRFIVHTTDQTAGRRILSRTFGLTSFSPARRVGSEVSQIVEACVAYVREWRSEHPDGATFGVRSRRSGTHAFSSQEAAIAIGSAVLADPEAGVGFKVDLGKPDLALHVDIRGNQTYVLHEVAPAPGGLPLGTAGRVVVLLKDVPSTVAAWLMMKRGCTVLPVHLEGITGRRERARGFEKVLKSWYLRGGLRELDYDEPEGYPKENVCAICMRQMLRKATAYARHRRAKSIVTGETLGSSTASMLSLTSDATSLTVLRPLVGLLPDFIAALRTKIGLDSIAGEDADREPCPLRAMGPADWEAVAAAETRLGLVAADAIVGPEASA